MSKYIQITLKEYLAISNEIQNLISSYGSHDKESQESIDKAAAALDRLEKRNAETIIALMKKARH